MPETNSQEGAFRGPAMPAALQASLRERMLAHKPAYLEQMAERKLRLDHLLAACMCDRLGMEERAELEALAHNMAGTGATFGFPDVSASGRDLMKQFFYHPEAGASAIEPFTRSLLAACEAALAE